MGQAIQFNQVKTQTVPSKPLPAETRPWHIVKHVTAIKPAPIPESTNTKVKIEQRVNKNYVTIDIPEAALVRPPVQTTATVDSFYDPDMTILHPN